MSKKLFGRLMSFTLSATVALTSGIPSLAYDGGGGDLPEDEEIQLLEEEEEIGSDLDVEDIILDEETEDVSFAEDDVDDAEFEALNDATITFKAVPGDDGAGTDDIDTRGAFTLAGDVATRITEDKALTKTKTFDSTRDFVFYVAPVMGYDWADSATAITLAGGYTYKDETEYKIKKGTDYTITDTDVTAAQVSSDYEAYDWSLAKKVTIIGNSNISKALAKAAQDVWADHESPSDNAATNENPILTVNIDGAALQTVQLNAAYEGGLTRPNIDMAVSAFRPGYNSPYTLDHIAKLVSDKDKKKAVKARVSLIGATEIKYEAQVGSFSDSSIVTDLEYFFDGDELDITTAGVNYAYKMAKQGYRLTVTLEEDTTQASQVVTIKPASTDYVTYAKVDQKTIAGATKITTSGVDATKTNRFVFFAIPDAKNDATRKIDRIYGMSEGNVITVTKAKIAIKNNDFTTYKVEGDPGYPASEDINPDDDTKYTQIADGYYIAGASVTKDITLYAQTSEQVIVKGGNDGTNDLITFTVNGQDKTIGAATATLKSGIAAGYGGAYAVDESEAITGKDYTFTIKPIPARAKQITALSVDMYNAKGDNYTTYSVAKGNLIADDYGKYTIPKITGKLVVNVTMAAEANDCTVLVTGDTADVPLVRWNDGVALPTGTASAFAKQGQTLKFKAVPVQGKAVKKISYAYGDDDYKELTGTMDSTGGTNYEITVTGNLKLKVESQVGYSFFKEKNPDAIVKVNGIEIKDDTILSGIPAGSGITVSITGKDSTVKVENRWYKYAATDPAYANKGAAAAASEWETETATLMPSSTDATNATTYEYYIYALTTRSEDSSKYTATIKNNANKAISALTLYAGGTALSSSTVAKHHEVLTTTFTRTDYATVSGTQKYTLGKTGDAAVATVATNTIKSTKVSGSDVITVVETAPTGAVWLAQVAYTAALPLTVKPLASYYDGGLTLVPDVDSTMTSMDGVGKTALRTYKSGVTNDNVDLTIQPYFINAKTGKKVARDDNGDGTGSDLPIASTEITSGGPILEIESIKWATTPKFSASQISGDLLVTPTTASGHTINITNIKNAGTVNATATVTYVDGSTDTATIDLTAVPYTLGYEALAVLTYNGKTLITDASPIGIKLEKKSGGVNSASVQYRVFEQLGTTAWSDIVDEIEALDTENGLVTEANITKYLAGDGKLKIKEVTGTFAKAAVYDQTTLLTTPVVADNVTATLNGSGYTITAAKVGSTVNAVIPMATVNGVAFSAPRIDVTVTNILPTRTVTMAINDAASTDYKKPQLKSSAAILSLPHSNDTDKVGEITQITFDSLTVGSKVTLPTISDFDAATVDPKRTLIGWDLGAGQSPRYVAPGTEVIVNNSVSGVAALWANKYATIGVYNDLTDTKLTSSENLGIGVTIPLSIRYAEIDWEKTPDNTNSGAPVYYSTLDKFSTKNTALTIKKAVTDSTAIEISGSTIKGISSNASAVLNFEGTIDGEEYTLSPANTSFNVQENVAHNLVMDPVTVEEGQTKRFVAYYYEADATKDDAIALDSSSATVTAKIKEAGKDNAEAAYVSGTKFIDVTGLKAGTTATLVVTVVSPQGDKTEKEVNVTVTSTKKKIVVKGDRTDDIQILVGAESVTDSGIRNTNVVFNYEYDGAVQDATGTWTVTRLDDPEDLVDVVLPDGVGDFSGATTSASGKDATIAIPTIADTYGTGKVKVTYTINNGSAGQNGGTADLSKVESFSAWFDVNTYYALTFTVQTGKEAAGNAYVVMNDGKAAKSTHSDYGGSNIVERFVYNGTKTHTSEKAAKIIAKYLTGDEANDVGNKNSSELAFFGWSEDGTNDAPTYANTDATYKAGQVITLDENDTVGDTPWPFGVGAENLVLYAQFGQKPITYITGLDSAITLTDEIPGTAASKEISTATATLTDYVVEKIGQNPADSTAPITITADDVGLFTITDGTALAVAVPNRNDSDGADTQLKWKTGSTAGFNVTMTPAGTPVTSRTGSFAIAKIAGKVGTSVIHVTASDLKYDIPIILNGEFTDTSVTPNVVRYMENGEILQEGTRTVAGKVHYYKDGKLITDGIIEVTVNGQKKLMIIENNVWIKTPVNAERAFKDKTYFIGDDGYLKTGLIDVNGKTYLFRPDGSKVFYTDSDVKDGKVDVDGTTYVIKEGTNEAEADHAHKWTATWAAWTVKDASTTVTLKCSVGGEEVTQTVGIVASEPNKAGIVTYTASITYAGETFTDVPKAAKKNGATEEIEEVLDISDGYGFYIDGLEEEYPYTGAAIKPSFAVIDASRGVYLAKGVDYTVSIKKNKKIGDVADVVVKGKGNYKDAAVTAHFTVVDPMKGVDQDDVELLKGAKIQFTTKSYVYTGEEILPTDIQLKLKGQSAFTTYEFNGTTYVDKEGNEIPGVWSVSNNVDKGTATLLLSGKNVTSGKKTVASSTKATYKITAAPFNEDDFVLTVDPTETEWAVKGAQPSVEVTWKGTPLIAGQDFKVTYDKANKAVGTATVTVSGKGNFTAKPVLSKSFTVTALDLAHAEIVASTAAAKVNAKSVKVTVLDANGDAIPAGNLAVTVYKDGSAVTGKLVADTEYTIVATPKNEKVTVLTGATPEFSVKIGTDIKKAKVAAKVKGYTVTYTGDPIVYDDDSFDDAFTVTIGGKTLKAGTDFEIAGHTNNIKKGTMVVTLQGIGDYCGTKPVKVKIVPKKLKK